MRARIVLSDLANGMPGVTAPRGAVMAEAGSVCLEGEGHGEEVAMRVDGAFDQELLLRRLEVSDQMRRSYVFETTTTEQGACGVAILVLSKLTPFTVIQEAFRGTRFDYWLGQPDRLLFQDAVPLEVSGLRRADESEIRERVRQKLAQLARSPVRGPGFVAVVEFSRPLARIVRR
jgi:hypothetical protein